MTVPLPSQAHSRDRRIALLRPAEARDEKVTHAMQLLSSMLWAFKGVTRSTWITSPLDMADVIVVHRDDRDERIPSWRASGRLIVEIATSSAAAIGNSHALVYPFRAAQVHSLLERLDVQLSAATNARESSAAVDAAWSFVNTIRSPSEASEWLVASEGKTPLVWIKADRHGYLASSATVLAIRQGTLPLSTLTLHTANSAPTSLVLREGQELSWFAAYHASDQLAPWLNAAARYRITRWPNFASIRPHPAQIRVAAALAAAEANVSQIAGRAHVPKQEAIRTLNALAVCAVLILADAKAAPPLPSQWAAPKPRGGLTAFLHNVRKHLGLGA